MIVVKSLEELYKLTDIVKGMPIKDILNDVYTEYSDDILYAQKQQMLQGKDSEGVSFVYPLSHFTDLFESGEWQDSLVIEGGEILSHNELTSVITKQIPNVFGIDKENTTLYDTLSVAIRDRIESYIRSRL